MSHWQREPAPQPSTIVQFKTDSSAIETHVKATPSVRGIAPLHILHLEDDIHDCALVKRHLFTAGIECSITAVRSQEEFAAALEACDVDLILADYSMPGFDGFSALDLARHRSPSVPFILVSGTVGEELAIDLLKRGATDYVLKERLSRLAPAVRRAMQEVRERESRQQAEAKREECSRKLQVLSRRLVEAQESERRHLARELHDELGQTLTVAQMNLQSVLQSPRPDDSARLELSLGAVERVLEQVRDLALNLRPSLLDDLGLLPALLWLTNRQAESAHLRGEVRADPLPQRLDPLVETTCFRIAQEALTNVIRHARAKSLLIELRCLTGWLHLRVRDDGIGFNVAATRERASRGLSLGLLSMEERAALVEGRLEITSHPGQGTDLQAFFPLRWRTANTPVENS